MKKIVLGLLLFLLLPMSVLADSGTFRFSLAGGNWSHGCIAPNETTVDIIEITNTTEYPLEFHLAEAENLEDSPLYEVMLFSINNSDFTNMDTLQSDWIRVESGDTCRIPFKCYMPRELGNQWQDKDLQMKLYFEGRLIEETDEPVEEVPPAGEEPDRPAPEEPPAEKEEEPPVEQVPNEPEEELPPQEDLDGSGKEESLPEKEPDSPAKEESSNEQDTSSNIIVEQTEDTSFHIRVEQEGNQVTVKTGDTNKTGMFLSLMAGSGFVVWVLWKGGIYGHRRKRI